MDESAVRLVALLSSQHKMEQLLANQQAKVAQLEIQQKNSCGASTGRIVYECHKLCCKLEALYEAHTYYALTLPAQVLTDLATNGRCSWIDQSSETWSSWDNIALYLQRQDINDQLCAAWRQKITLNLSSAGRQPDKYAQYVTSCAFDLRRCSYDQWRASLDQVTEAVTATEIELGQAYDSLQDASSADKRKQVAEALRNASELAKQQAAEVTEQTKQISSLKRSLGLPDQLS